MRDGDKNSIWSVLKHGMVYVSCTMVERCIDCLLALQHSSRIFLGWESILATSPVRQLRSTPCLRTGASLHRSGSTEVRQGPTSFIIWYVTMPYTPD